MSLLPYMFREMMRPMKMMEQQMRMVPEEFFRPMNSIFHHFPVLFPEHQGMQNKEAILSDKEKFQIKLDVQHFAPQELTVKTNDDNSVIIEGKHEEKQDGHGSISRHFVRKFVLPEGHEMKKIISSLSPDGVLTITAPRKPELEATERLIPITHVGGQDEAKKED